MMIGRMMAGVAMAGASAAAALAGEARPNVYPAAYFAEAQPTSAFDMIGRLPGFTFEAGDSEVRGLAGAGGNVLIDGRAPTSKQDDLETLLRRIPARAVLRIELIGPGTPGIDMQGRSLLANVVRRSEAVTRGNLSAGVALHDNGVAAPTLTFDINRRTGDRLLEASASIGRTVDDGKGAGPRVKTGPNRALQSAAIYAEDKGARVIEAAIGHERPLAGGRLRLDASVHDEDTRADITERRSFPSASLEVVTERETAAEREVGARYERPLPHGWAVETLALYHATTTDGRDEAVEGRDLTVNASASRASEAVVRATGRREGRAASLTVGGEAALNRLDSATRLNENGVDAVLPSANVQVEERRAEARLVADWRPTASLSLEAGARIEASTLTQRGGPAATEASFVYLKPRAALTWAGPGGAKLRAEVERVLGQLDFQNFVSSTSLTSNTITAGNPDLQPDKTWRSSISWEQPLGGRGAIAVTLRHDAISDAIDRVPVTGPGYAFDAPGNVGAATRDEIQIDLTAPLGRVIPGGLIKAGITGRRSRVIDPTTGQARGLSDEPGLEGAVHFTQDLPRRRAQWGIDLVLAENTRQYRFDEVRFDHDDARWSVFVELHPARAWTMRAELDNLTDGKAVRRREQYAGLRSAYPLARIETRALAHGAFAGVSLQRAFGG